MEMEIDMVIELANLEAYKYCDRCNKNEDCNYDGEPRDCPEFKRSVK